MADYLDKLRDRWDGEDRATGDDILSVALKMRAALRWYENYAAALGRDFPAEKDEAVVASVTAISLDGGKRARKALSAETKKEASVSGHRPDAPNEGGMGQ